ncbi:hypothetical protein [Burkholderia stagnalis]|uniref:hypothetical protein n=1 Tax=Burkholderia stagnalis TaxID=1503054 RepID=UPI0012DAD5F5|nr:hypothetical protein [Burkholderia stagnalis]
MSHYFAYPPVPLFSVVIDDFGNEINLVSGASLHGPLTAALYFAVDGGVFEEICEGGMH